MSWTAGALGILLVVEMAALWGFFVVGCLAAYWAEQMEAWLVSGEAALKVVEKDDGRVGVRVGS